LYGDAIMPNSSNLLKKAYGFESKEQLSGIFPNKCKMHMAISFTLKGR